MYSIILVAVFAAILFAVPVILTILLIHIKGNKKAIHDTALHYGVNGPGNKMF